MAFAMMPRKDRLLDSFGRFASKLRISVTDRCNFRCFFCMPTNPIWLTRGELLTFEEIARLARIFASMGVSKIRLTGGEPLMRRGIERLVLMLSQVPGIESIGMTTNGFLLAEKAASLKESGLSVVNISLHSLKPDRYEEMVKAKGVFERVLDGIQAAKDVGLRVKINCTIIKGCNDDEVLDFARLAYEGSLTVRFIEYMPFDGDRLWGIEKVVGGREIVEEIRGAYGLVRVPRERGSTAQLYRFKEGSGGEIGVITSMTEPFCGDCDRIRLKADGKIVPCMFSTAEYDIKPLLRGGASDEELEEFIRRSFWMKAPGVEALLKRHALISHVRPMHTIGG